MTAALRALRPGPRRAGRLVGLQHPVRAPRAPARLPDALLRLAAGVGLAHGPDPQARALGEPARGDLPVRARGVRGHARARGVRGTSARGAAARAPRASTATSARRELGLPANARIVALLPGSRGSELRHLLPLQLEVARVLHARDPRIHFVLPRAASLARETLEAGIRAARLPSLLQIDVLEGHSQIALRAADVALLKPGTSTLEAALLDCPLVVAARTNRLTAWILRRLVRVDTLTMPNLIAGEPIVPEFLQEEARPEAIADAVLALLERARARRAARAAGGRAAGAREGRRRGARGRDRRGDARPWASSGIAPRRSPRRSARPWRRARSRCARAGARAGASGSARGRSPTGAIWVHAASVGEVTASARLVERLRARGRALTLSTTSATGRALCAQLHPGVAHRLAPLDHPVVRRRGAAPRAPARARARGDRALAGLDRRVRAPRRARGGRLGPDLRPLAAALPLARPAGSRARSRASPRSARAPSRTASASSRSAPRPSACA